MIAGRLREFEHRGDFGAEFVELSRANLAKEDLRETIKRRIDDRLRSETTATDSNEEAGLSS